MFQQIVVLGAGAIGSAYGALLSRDNDVLLVGRQTHVETINTGGLVIEGDYAGIYSPSATYNLEEVLPETLLIVTTKAYDLASSLSSIRSLILDDTVLLLLQNGLNIEEIARKVVKKQRRVVRGLVTLASEMLSPGRVKVWRGDIVLGSDELSKAIAQLFEKSGIQTKTSSTFTQEIWRKCIINSIINPLTAILQVHNNEISTPELAWIRHSIGRESMAVGTAEGIDFKADLLEFIEEIIPQYTNRSSMCQDIQRGRPTEIAFINGRIVELGKQHGIPTPINKCLTQLVRFLEVRSS